MKSNSHLYIALAGALLLTACSSSSGATSQTESRSVSSGALDGVKNRVPLYVSNLTDKPGTIAAGTYQFETSDSPAQVFAWYKAQVPSSLGGTWATPDPDAAPAWGFKAKPAGGVVSIVIQPVNPAYASGYSKGSKTIVAVTDK